MRLAFAIVFLCPLVFGQQLKVKSATARKVVLTWDTSAASWVIERKTPLGTFRKIGTAPNPYFEDSTIEGDATYQYRVHAAASAAKTSNEITVGPPAWGILNVAPVPKKADPAKYGPNAVMALDENGDPAVAFVWFDPDGDSNASDSEVMFVRYNRATGKWVAPVKVATVGNIPSQNVEPISLAFDVSAGLVAVSYPVEGHEGFSIATSRDGGATWQAVSTQSGIEGTVSTTALAMNEGKFHLMLNCEGNGVHYFTGDLRRDPATWLSMPAPTPAGLKQHYPTSVSLILDSSGKPLAGYFLTQEDGTNDRFMVWRPGEGAPVQAMDSNSQQTDDPSLRLAGSNRFGLLVDSNREGKDNEAGIWFTGSGDGTTWTAPVKLPIDGPRATNSPLGLAIDSRGRFAAVFGSNGGAGETKCGYPVMSRSVDGHVWSTCGVGFWTASKFNPQPETVSVVFSASDKVYVLWQETADSRFGQGLLLYHER